jgi:hypothetical protein
MRPRKITCPGIAAEGDIIAEGIDPVPYDTDIVSSQGCHIHLWLGNREVTPDLLTKLTRIARWNRDIVSVSYSDGAPIDYWARQTMSWNT